MTLALSKTLTAGTPENIEDVQTMFNELVAYVNSLTAVEFVPGDVVCQAGPSLPAGWLFCDGAAVSRSTYTSLFGALGVSYGAGDGSTTFNVPDLRDCVPVGASGTIGLANRGGEKTHALSIAELPSGHYPATSTSWVNVAVSAGSGQNVPKSATILDYAGAGTAHNNMQPYVGMHWRIKT